MTAYSERWAEEGRDWANLFAQVDQWLEDFASAHHMEITAWHWDAPDRTLSWGAGLRKNLHIYISGDPGKYAFTIAGAAWRDTSSEGSPERRLYQTRLREIQIPADLTVPLDDFQKAVQRSYEIVEEWREDAEWRRVPLSPPRL